MSLSEKIRGVFLRLRNEKEKQALVTRRLKEIEERKSETSPEKLDRRKKTKLDIEYDKARFEYNQARKRRGLRKIHAQTRKLKGSSRVDRISNFLSGADFGAAVGGNYTGESKKKKKPRREFYDIF